MQVKYVGSFLTLLALHATAAVAQAAEPAENIAGQQAITR